MFGPQTVHKRARFLGDRIRVAQEAGGEAPERGSLMPIAFRNVDASPTDDIRTWPYEALVTVIDRGLVADGSRFSPSFGGPLGGPFLGVWNAICRIDSPTGSARCSGWRLNVPGLTPIVPIGTKWPPGCERGGSFRPHQRRVRFPRRNQCFATEHLPERQGQTIGTNARQDRTCGRAWRGRTPLTVQHLAIKLSGPLPTVTRLAVEPLQSCGLRFPVLPSCNNRLLRRYRILRFVTMAISPVREEGPVMPGDSRYLACRSGVFHGVDLVQNDGNTHGACLNAGRDE